MYEIGIKHKIYIMIEVILFIINFEDEFTLFTK